MIGVEDEEFGQRLKAFVVAEAGAELDEDELKAHVKANLAAYKTPREIEFLDELPRNATGKVLKRELHAREAAAVRLSRSCWRKLRQLPRGAAWWPPVPVVVCAGMSEPAGQLRRASARRPRPCTASPGRRWSGSGSARSGSPRPRRGPRACTPS